ncbi:DUF4142 domain-containing protein [Rufibacter latericius]|uniref:DUF4142 domain-containing protein n=1 Tax=Rufibacter latericius TaxID=2487040 RepID=A0A3M9MKX0_9BACT|nr:DUF4142 domain-containing protein [Rufibacter latericius]RNI25867.1 DUF4142 domain-containing protein [Rufibacter latericius]
MKKTNVWMLLWALMVSCTVMVSCDDDDEDADMGQDNARVATFLQAAAQSDMFEITTGTMAQTKGETDDVQMFGEMLVEDHTMTAQKIMEMADERDVQLPTTLPPAKVTIVNSLQGQSGIAFDKAFATAQVQAHQEAITLYETADQQITDPEVQTFIDATLPALRLHLQHAQQVKTMVDAM